MKKILCMALLVMQVFVSASQPINIITSGFTTNKTSTSIVASFTVANSDTIVFRTYVTDSLSVTTLKDSTKIDPGPNNSVTVNLLNLNPGSRYEIMAVSTDSVSSDTLIYVDTTYACQSGPPAIIVQTITLPDTLVTVVDRKCGGALFISYRTKTGANGQWSPFLIDLVDTTSNQFVIDTYTVNGNPGDTVSVQCLAQKLISGTIASDTSAVTTFYFDVLPSDTVFFTYASFGSVLQTTADVECRVYSDSGGIMLIDYANNYQFTNAIMLAPIGHLPQDSSVLYGATITGLTPDDSLYVRIIAYNSMMTKSDTVILATKTQALPLGAYTISIASINGNVPNPVVNVVYNSAGATDNAIFAAVAQLSDSTVDIATSSVVFGIQNGSMAPYTVTVNQNISSLIPNTTYMMQARMFCNNCQYGLVSSAWVPFVYMQTTGIADNLAIKVNAFPNPTTGLVYKLPEGSIKIYDASGKMVDDTLTDGTYNLSSFPKGIYLLHGMSNEGALWVARISKE